MKYYPREPKIVAERRLALAGPLKVRYEGRECIASRQRRLNQRRQVGSPIFHSSLTRRDF